MEEPSLTLLWGTWELWCDLPPLSGAAESGGSWLDQVKSIGLFDSAEGFWGLFNCTLLPSQLPPNGSYYLFRKHIAPMWEHEANRRGGRWVMTFTVPAPSEATPHSSEGEEEALLPVDLAWQRMCLAAIGELFPCAEEELCGITISRGKPRSGTGHAEIKLNVWTRTATDEETQLRIAKFIKSTLASELQDASLEARSPTTPERDFTPTQTILQPKTICYMAHREVIEAKQQYSKGTMGGGMRSFKPKYVA
ncbi:translation initiation factor 4E [Strigomonas culicis]|nr:translation initiation factor 4E [Strigomonas culicis]|eukprot:EPY34134.1 translation initiation factor 4E [Strigomonas culicis]